MIPALLPGCCLATAWRGCAELESLCSFKGPLATEPQPLLTLENEGLFGQICFVKGARKHEISVFVAHKMIFCPNTA